MRRVVDMICRVEGFVWKKLNSSTALSYRAVSVLACHVNRIPVSKPASPRRLSKNQKCLKVHCEWKTAHVVRVLSAGYVDLVGLVRSIFNEALSKKAK